MRSIESTLVAAFACATMAAGATELPPLTVSLNAVERVPAPAIELEDLDGENVSLGDFRGNVVVVNFWATWCPPCRREMPSLERLYRLTGEAVEILAVNVGEDFETVFGFLGGVEPTPSFPVLLDLDGETVERWGVLGLPTTFVVDQQGDIVYRAVGGREFDHPDISSLLERLSGAGSPAR